eukprot:gene14966-16664_t
MSNITCQEAHYIESCYNGALISIDPSYINKPIQCYGYDYSACYPNLLVSNKLKMPIRVGTRRRLTSLPTKLEYGIYKVKVVNFPNHLFKLNKFNFYTHYDIEFLLNNDYEVELIQVPENEFNAMIWYSDSLIYTEAIFRPWFDILAEAKQQLKGNKIVKRLLSSLWGTLCSFNKQYINDDEDLPSDFSMSSLTSDEQTTYKQIDVQVYETKITYTICKKDSIYKHNFARLKPFLISFARINLANFILKHDLTRDIVRIHTDNVTLRNPIKNYKSITGYKPIPEDKTTGYFTWKNVCIKT